MNHPMGMKVKKSISNLQDNFNTGSRREILLHDKLFQNQDNLSELDILNYANQVGLNISQFSTCIKSDEAQNEVSQELVDGANAGALGTPTWFINGNRFAGVIPEDVFREIITEFSN